MFSCGKRERTYFLAQHTLLQICNPVDAVVVKVITIIAWSGKLECSGEGRMDVRQKSRCVGGVQ